MKITDIKEPVELNESQRAMLLLALSIAADQFKQDAAMTRTSMSGLNDLGRERLARQYEDQAYSAQELSNRIDDSQWIKLGPVETRDQQP